MSKLCGANPEFGDFLKELTPPVHKPCKDINDPLCSKDGVEAGLPTNHAILLERFSRRRASITDESVPHSVYIHLTRTQKNQLTEAGQSSGAQTALFNSSNPPARDSVVENARFTQNEKLSNNLKTQCAPDHAEGLVYDAESTTMTIKTEIGRYICTFRGGPLLPNFFLEFKGIKGQM